jgi:MoxR-vWA-beta-propeller ternary system domain bpX2
MKEMILLIAEKDKEALGAVRCVDGLRTAVNSKGIWLRINEEQAKSGAIQQLPVMKTYFIDANNYLFLPGNVTPVDILDVADWFPIKQFIPVEIPVAAIPAKVKSQVPISIIPSEKVRNGNALRTSLVVWKVYAENAPAVRLQALKFAVSENKEVFITGNPLPSIPGKEYWIQDKIAMPCGYDFEWPFLAAAIAGKLEVQDELIVFDENGNWQRLAENYFVHATRSAIRLTTINIYVPG